MEVGLVKGTEANLLGYLDNVENLSVVTLTVELWDEFGNLVSVLQIIGSNWIRGLLCVGLAAGQGWRQTICRNLEGAKQSRRQFGYLEMV